jgi:hypothetical protein
MGDPDDERDVKSVMLEDDDGNPVVIEQQNVGFGREVGSGEFPHPDTPPKNPGRAADEQEELDGDSTSG